MDARKTTDAGPPWSVEAAKQPRKREEKEEKRGKKDEEGRTVDERGEGGERRTEPLGNTVP